MQLDGVDLWRYGRNPNNLITASMLWARVIHSRQQWAQIPTSRIAFDFLAHLYRHPKYVDVVYLTYLTSIKSNTGFFLLVEKLTCVFQKWKYYIDYEHMTVNTEGFDSKFMWYLCGNCILTKYSYYRSSQTFIIISEHIFNWKSNAIPQGHNFHIRRYAAAYHRTWHICCIIKIYWYMTS